MSLQIEKLLTLAATSVGLTVVSAGNETLYTTCTPEDDSTGWRWNPLLVAEDWFGLVASLKINIGFHAASPLLGALDSTPSRPEGLGGLVTGSIYADDETTLKVSRSISYEGKFPGEHTVRLAAIYAAAAVSDPDYRLPGDL